MTVSRVNFARNRDGGEMSNTTRRQRAAVAAVAIGSAGASAIVAAPAAAHHKEQCPGNTVCVWEDGKLNGDHGFNGAVHWIGPNSIDLHYDTCPGCVYGSDPSQSLNDSISAVWNNSDRWYQFFQNSDGLGAVLCFEPGAASPDLQNVSFPGPLLDWSNRISGGQPGGPGGCDTTITENGCSI
jgi:hypothetical protein